MEKLYESDNPNSKFIKGYVIYICILLVLALGITTYLWIRLSKYQAGIDEEAKSIMEGSAETSSEDEEKAAQKYFTDYLETLNADSFATLYFSNHPDRFDTIQDATMFVTDRIVNAGFEPFKASDFSVQSPKYVLMSNGETLAEFTLTGSNKDWGIETAQILISGDNTLTVKAPAGSKVFINGHELLEDYAQVEKVAASLDDYDDDLTNPVIFNEYTITNMINPEAVVEVDNGLLACDKSYYDINAIGQENKDRAEAFVKSLLHYYAMGKENTSANQSDVLSYVAGNSNASKVIYSASSGLEWVVADYSLSYTVRSQDPLKLADNCYFIDVAYELEGGRNNSQKAEANDNEEAADADENEAKESDDSDENDNSHGVYRVYFLDNGDGYKIVEFAGVK